LLQREYPNLRPFYGHDTADAANTRKPPEFYR
jgi:hypothetical protein